MTGVTDMHDCGALIFGCGTYLHTGFTEYVCGSHHIPNQFSCEGSHPLVMVFTHTLGCDVLENR